MENLGNDVIRIWKDNLIRNNRLGVNYELTSSWEENLLQGLKLRAFREDGTLIDVLNIMGWREGYNVSGILFFVEGQIVITTQFNTYILSLSCLHPTTITYERVISGTDELYFNVELNHDPDDGVISITLSNLKEMRKSTYYDLDVEDYTYEHSLAIVITLK